MARIKERKRADGGITYQVNWVLGGGSPKTGKEQSESFTSRNRAESFKLDVEHAGHAWPDGWIKGEGYVQIETKPKSTTMADLADLYWERKARSVKRGRLKPYTLQRDKRAYALHIEPTFGEKELAEISLDDVEEWLDDQVDSGAKPKTIRNRHGLLSAMLKLGVLKRYMPINPCEGSELPEDTTGAQRHVKFFTQSEWKQLRPKFASDVLLLCDMLLATGMRWGELTALMGMDCSRNERDEVVIQVARAWSGRADDDPAPIREELSETKRWKLDPYPKNRKARFAVVSGELADRLWHRVQSVGDDGYLFARQKSPWRHEHFHVERWQPAVKEAKLSKHVTPHMLRHSFAVWSIAAGVPIEKVSEALGHASIQITWDVYGGLLDLADPAAAKAMAKAMAG